MAEIPTQEMFTRFIEMIESEHFEFITNIEAFKKAIKEDVKFFQDDLDDQIEGIEHASYSKGYEDRRDEDYYGDN